MARVDGAVGGVPGAGPGRAGVLREDALSAAFDRAAGRYDLMVALNPGYHADLRRSARRLGLPGGSARPRVLDLGCGTGASTAALLAAAPAARITAVDASVGMLAHAAAKSWRPHVRWVRADAGRLAEAGVRGPFDAVFAAYLVRNVPEPTRVLDEAYRLLVPGGRLVVHEYTLSGRRAHRAVWDAVCGTVVLPLAALAGDGRLYRHLWRSVVEFDTAPAFHARLRGAGFTDVRTLPLPGWQTGITHTFTARRAPGRSGPRAEGRG